MIKIFTPPPLLVLPGNCKAWYDFTDTSVIESTANAMSRIFDKSGVGNHGTQGTTLAQPATGTRTLNGLNVADFDGSNSTLNIPSFIPELTNGQVSVFAVLKADTSGTTKTALGSNSTSRLYLQQGTANQYVMRFGALNVSVGGVATDATIVYYTYDGLTDTYAAKVSSNATIATGTTALTGTPGGLTLGNRSGVGEFFDGVVAEYIGYDKVLTAGEILFVVDYLSKKFGITVL